MMTNLLIAVFGCPQNISLLAIGGMLIGPFVPILLVVVIERMVRHRKKRPFRFSRAFGSILFVLWGIFSCYWISSLFGWVGDCGGF